MNGDDNDDGWVGVGDVREGRMLTKFPFRFFSGAAKRVLFTGFDR